MNLEDVDRELDSLGPTPASLPIERLGDLAAVDAVLASLGEGAPLAAPPERATASATSSASAKPATPPPTAPKSAVPAIAKPPSAPRPPAPKSAMPPPPPKSVMPRVPEPTRQVVAPEKPGTTDSSTRQVVAPSPSSPGSLSADDLFADLADDDVPSAPSERPVEPPAETASETTNETSSPLAELFSDLDEEVADVGSLFEEEPPSEERLSLELGDFDDLVAETGTTSALPSAPPSAPSPSVAAPSVPAPSVAPSVPSTPPRAPSVAPAAADDFDDFDEPVADSTSLFSAADVAAIRRASSVPAPMASARPATPSPLDELVLEDDFELLIDDDEDSTADGVESSGDEGEEPGDDADPSGKKGFFKKLFG